MRGCPPRLAAQPLMRSATLALCRPPEATGYEAGLGRRVAMFALLQMCRSMPSKADATPSFFTIVL
jgi:hypothetical protein